MRHVLAALFLALFWLLPVQAQDNEAEKLFRDLEKKIKAADAVQIIAEVFAAGNEKPRSKFFLLFTRDNRARLKETTGVASTYTWELISDGTKMKLGAISSDSKNPIPIEKREAEAAPANLHDRICSKLARPGIGLSKLSGADSGYSWWRKEKIGPKDTLYKLEGFKMSDPEKIAGRDAKVIRYSVQPGGVPVTLWIDTETLLPLQSVQGAWGKGFVGTKEVYREFKLNPKVEAKAFDLPN